MMMIEGILAGNLLDLLIGFLAGWLMVGATKKKYSVGAVIICFYILSIVGQSIDYGYISIGIALHMISFCLAFSAAFFGRKWKLKRARKNKRL
jgi:hypothetical protein